MRILLAALVCLAGLHAESKPANAFDKPTLEAYLRHLLAMAPEVEVKISDPIPSPVPGMKQVDVHMSLGGRYQDETFLISNDGKNLIRGYAYDISKNPFQPELDKLNTEGAPSFGPADAKVTMVVFSDFQCPNCKEEAKLIRENAPLRFPKDLRVYFKNFPLEAIHPWAKAAAIAGRCVYDANPPAFWKYHDWMYETQEQITPENLKDKVLQWGKSNDLDTLQLGHCIDTKATEAQIDREIAQGRALKVEGTPTTFIDGRRLFGNYPWPNLEQIINGELKYQQTEHAAAEKCCEISLPSPLKK